MAPEANDVLEPEIVQKIKRTRKNAVNPENKGKGKSKAKKALNELQQINMETKHTQMLELIKEKYVPRIKKIQDNIKNSTQKTVNVEEINELDVLKRNYTKELTNYYGKATQCLIEYYTEKQQDVPIESNNTSFVDIVSRTVQKNNFSKATILEKYLLRFDPRYTPANDEKEIFCKFCGSNLNMASSEGETLCVVCGYTRDSVLEGVKMSYKDVSSRQTNENYSYSKCGHLDFHLSHLQGKPVPLPDTLIPKLKELVQGDGVKPKSLTIIKIRGYLKRIGATQFYENANYIIELLGGPKSPKLDKDFIELVRSLFARLLVPFRNIRKELFSNTNNKDRRNLVIYNFILYKLFDMLGRQDLLKFLCLLKTTKINIQLEYFWYVTCKECNFNYTK
jgi:hypothetical protein